MLPTVDDARKPETEMNAKGNPIIASILCFYGYFAVVPFGMYSVHSPGPPLPAVLLVARLEPTRRLRHWISQRGGEPRHT